MPPPYSEEEVAKPALSGSMCELVWQGTVKARSFPAFRFQVGWGLAVGILGSCFLFSSLGRFVSLAFVLLCRLPSPLHR